jgi:hypothetical protein
MARQQGRPAREARVPRRRRLVRQPEVREVPGDARVEGGRGDALAELVGLVIAANLRAALVHGAAVVGPEVRAGQAEGLVEGRDVRRDAAGAAAGAGVAHGAAPRRVVVKGPAARGVTVAAMA